MLQEFPTGTPAVSRLAAASLVFLSHRGTKRKAGSSRGVLHMIEKLLLPGERPLLTKKVGRQGRLAGRLYDSIRILTWNFFLVCF